MFAIKSSKQIAFVAFYPKRNKPNVYQANTVLYQVLSCEKL